jgi:riboflavin kinase/FMN adenylyltransferase
VGGVAIVRFTKDVALWDPETFVRRVLREWLGVAEVWVGANFVFGHDRAGNVTKLRQLGARYGFRAEAIEPVRYKEFVVSSSRARQLIGEGRVEEAATMLGRHYSLDGIVVHGLQRGRMLGFPTANLDSENELLPPNGVYATMATLDGSVSVTNIGSAHVSPAVGDVVGPRLDIDRDCAKGAAGVRPPRPRERTFDGVAALKANRRR